MDVVEERSKQRRPAAERLAKPLRACFKSEQEAQQEWEEQDTESLMAVGLINVESLRPSSKVMEEFAEQVRRVRGAQKRGDHLLAIKLTTRALRLIREQPRYRRGALNRQTQELLNLRSVSLIALGECGEAWRCITLMSKLWS